jgi:hypothetical protein
MSTVPHVRPGKAMESVRDRGFHQVMPRRMKQDFVTPVAIAIMGVQRGRILVCFNTPSLRLFSAQSAPEFDDFLFRPGGIPTINGSNQRCVRGEKVVVDQRGNLVRVFHVVRFSRGDRSGCHASILTPPTFAIHFWRFIRDESNKSLLLQHRPRAHR